MLPERARRERQVAAIIRFSEVVEVVAEVVQVLPVRVEAVFSLLELVAEGIP